MVGMATGTGSSELTSFTISVKLTEGSGRKEDFYSKDLKICTLPLGAPVLHSLQH